MARHITARRVPIFVDPLHRHSSSEESLVVCVERKSIGHVARRRSSSLDTNTKNGKILNRRSLADKVHIG